MSADISVNITCSDLFLNSPKFSELTDTAHITSVWKKPPDAPLDNKLMCLNSDKDCDILGNIKRHVARKAASGYFLYAQLEWCPIRRLQWNCWQCLKWGDWATVGSAVIYKPQGGWLHSWFPQFHAICQSINQPIREQIVDSKKKKKPTTIPMSIHIQCYLPQLVVLSSENTVDINSPSGERGQIQENTIERINTLQRSMSN